jgi:cyclase
MAVLARRIIACLDIDRGRVVKGVRFADTREVGDPVSLCRRYDAEGADELVFYDISASAEGRATTVEVVARVAACAFVPLTVGGGVESVEDMRRLLRAGADKVSVNTAAVRDPELIARGADRFGSQCIVLSIDARRATVGPAESPRWEVVTHGGRQPTGMDAVEWAVRGERLGAGEVVLNAIDADGVRAGYDVRWCRAVAAAVRIPVVASGGAGTMEHFAEVLAPGAADAALAASVFHSGRIAIPELKAYLAARGVAVRPAGGTCAGPAETCDPKG